MHVSLLSTIQRARVRCYHPSKIFQPCTTHLAFAHLLTADRLLVVASRADLSILDSSVSLSAVSNETSYLFYIFPTSHNYICHDNRSFYHIRYVYTWNPGPPNTRSVYDSSMAPL